MLTLGAVQRLDYNRRRYELNDEAKTAAEAITPPDRHEAAARLNRAILNVQAFQNLQYRYESSRDERFIPGLILLFQRINTQLYTLHHDILEHDADLIVSLIDPLDEEMRRWSYEQLSEEPSGTKLPSGASLRHSLKNLHALRRLTMQQLPPA